MTRARDFADVISGQFDIPAGSLDNASADVVGDTTPQLGGNLDLNSNDITGTGNIDVTGTVTADGLTVDGDASLDGTAVNFIFNETDTTDLNTRLRQSGALFSVATVNDSGSSPKAHIVVNNSLGDISFYDNTGTTQGFYWDASTQRLGLGTTSPDRSLHITGTEPSVVLENSGQGTDLKTWRIYSNSSSLQVGTVDDAFAAGQNALEIGRDNTDNITNIQFKTGASAERMRVTSGGNVGIGTTNPLAKLHVDDTNSALYFGYGGNEDIYLQTTNGNVYFTNKGASSTRMQIDSSGNVTISGSLSKGSGSFRIDHPIKPKTHDLVHSFVEAPKADNIYRGKINLIGGSATVNIDTFAGMTEGTFVALNRDIQCFTSNESGWTAVKGSVSGNVLTITAQDNNCTDTVSWLVIGERQDQHMYDAEWTDENGKIIVEPEKVIEQE